MIAYAKYLSQNTSYYQVTNQWQRTTLIDTKIRDLAEDADKRWIITWQPGTIIRFISDILPLVV
jgi:hypothetical protein